MRTTAMLLTTLCLTALAVTSANAANDVRRPRDISRLSPLYTLDKTARPPGSGPLGVPDAAEEFTIEVNPEIVAANPPAFTIDLPTIPSSLEAVRTRFVVYRPDWKSWIGTLRYAGSEGEGTGYIHLGYHGKQLTALIDFEGERYRIVGGLWQSHRLVRLSDELSVPSCGLADAAFGDTEPLHLEGKKLGVKPEPVAAPKAATRLDVLAVYPRVFFDFGPAAEAGLFNFIEDSISLANDLFANSQVNAFYKLVGIVPLTGAQPPATGIFDALSWLNSRPTEVSNLRNAFGADIVTIYVPFIWSADANCGVANLPQNNGTFRAGNGTVLEPMGDRAFTANRDSCGLSDFTLGHEIGHNYGMRHDDSSNSSVVLFTHGRGHLLTVNGQQKATAMGCTCGFSPKPPCDVSQIANAVCNRIPYFSDPNIFYLGVPTGTPSVPGGDPGRNNAAVGRTQVATYAGFKPQSSNTPPTANFTVSCSGRTCTFNASSSTDNVALPTTASNYWWDFGDGTTGTGRIVNHTYSSGTFFWVHLVVKDSGGQKDVTLNSASPQ